MIVTTMVDIRKSVRIKSTITLRSNQNLVRLEVKIILLHRRHAPIVDIICVHMREIVLDLHRDVPIMVAFQICQH